MEDASSRALAALRSTSLLRAVMIAIHSGWISGSEAERAFLLCCFSELAYAALLPSELDRAGRYKLLHPAAIAHELARLKISLPVQTLLSRTLDVPLRIVPGRGSVCLVGRMQDTAVVAVRGTFRKREWAINLAAPPVLPVGRRYHAGYGLEAATATPMICKALDELGPFESIRFTGHSLGGALAAILAQSDAFPAPARRAYVFAAPRFGNARAVRLRAPRAFSRTDDLVPSVPPRSWGYSNPEPVWLPEGAEPLPARAVLKQWRAAARSRKFAEPHQIEWYRRDVGLLIGQDFPHDAYIRALREAFAP